MSLMSGITRTGLEWSSLDPASRDAAEIVAGWLTLLAESADRSGNTPPPCPVDMVGSLRFAPPDTELEDVVVRRDGRVVGALRLALPAGAPVIRVDQLLVHPVARRQGIGRALVAHAVGRLAEHGRTSLTATLSAPVPGGPVVDETPSAFAAAVGALSVAGEGTGLHQWLDLAEHDPLADGVPAVPPGYRLVTWGTVTPDEYAVAVSSLEQSLGGGPELPDEEIETSYARRFEKMRIGRGRRAYHTGVVHEASGKLAGYTSISKTTGNPEHALQGMTVVHATHRGHGLGRVIKLTNLDQARRAEPALRLLETANAAHNTPMIELNAAIGFRPDTHWIPHHLTP